MNFLKSLYLTTLTACLVSCGSTPEQKAKDLNLVATAKDGQFTLGNSFSFALENKKNHEFSSVSYMFNGQTVSENTEIPLNKLGAYTLEASVVFGDKPVSVKKEIVVLNTETPKVYSYKILNEYPHDITSYTQGLEFYNGSLYESTGQYGESKLRKLDYKTGEVLKNIDLDKAYFGEGLTILNTKLYQLTWRRGTGFVYDVETLEKTGSFKYGQSKEGWGLCNDGSKLYKSDGTDHIWTLNADTQVEEDFIQVYTNKGKIGALNELEWVDGKIYANIYQRNGVAIIDPKTGAVEGVIDFSPLHKLVTQHQNLDVLNGIAFNPETNTLFVTGKDWDKLFEVEILE